MSYSEREISGHSGPKSTYPNPFERVIRVARDMCAIVALTLASLLMLSVVNALGSFADRINEIQAPAPAETECVGELC